MRRKHFSPRFSIPAAVFAALLLVFDMCGDSNCCDPDPIPVSLSAPLTTVTSGEGSQFLSIGAPGPWTLALTFGKEDEPWAQVSATQGTGSTSSVYIHWQKNTTASKRSVTLSLQSGTSAVHVPFTQEPSDSPSGPSTGTDPTPGRPTGNVTPGEGPWPSVSRGWLELPATSGSDGLDYLCHYMTMNGVKKRNYSLYFDYSTLVASWVAYPLNAGLIGSGSRSDAWGDDPLLPSSKQAVLFGRSYQNASGSWSGHDRGHQLPSADRLGGDANEQTFYGTNMTPQNSTFNQGLWGNIEGKVRSWAKSCDTLYVVTGCVTKGSTEVDYDNEGKAVTVPVAYFKAVLRYAKSSTIGISGSDGAKYNALALYYENKSYSSKNLEKEYTMSISDLEKKLGYDLFVNLPGRAGVDAARQIEAENPQNVTWWWN